MNRFYEFIESGLLFHLQNDFCAGKVI